MAKQKTFSDSPRREIPHQRSALGASSWIVIATRSEITEMRETKLLSATPAREIAHAIGISFMRCARVARCIGEAGRMPQQILDSESRCAATVMSGPSSDFATFMPAVPGKYLLAGSVRLGVSAGA